LCICRSCSNPTSIGITRPAVSLPATTGTLSVPIHRFSPERLSSNTCIKAPATQRVQSATSTTVSGSPVTQLGRILAAAFLYAVHHAVHCRDTARNAQRYLIHVGEKRWWLNEEFLNHTQLNTTKPCNLSTNTSWHFSAEYNCCIAANIFKLGQARQMSKNNK